MVLCTTILMCDAPINSRAQDHYHIYTNYHTNIQYSLNGSIPLSWYTANPIYISCKPVPSISSNAHLFIATSIAHLLAASISHSFTAASTQFPKDSPPFTLMYTQCKSGQLWDSALIQSCTTCWAGYHCLLKSGTKVDRHVSKVVK